MIREAAGILRAGGLVVLPTETVYGLAAALGVPGALERLYRAKGRPAHKPTARFVRGAEDLEREGVTLAGAARRLAERFWPGPLTLVVPTGKGDIGWRVPDHPVCQAILGELGEPLAVTSANRSGGAEARTAQEAAKELGESVDLVLDAGRTGDAPPSTVVRVRGREVEVLRWGALGREALAAALAGLEVEWK